MREYFRITYDNTLYAPMKECISDILLRIRHEVRVVTWACALYASGLYSARMMVVFGQIIVLKRDWCILHLKRLCFRVIHHRSCQHNITHLQILSLR